MSDNDPFALARRHFGEGVAHAEAGRLDEAERSFTEALALAPGRPSVLANLGIVRLRAGRADQALAPLAQAVQAQPDNVDAWAHQGLAHAALGDHAAAVVSLDRALALASDRAVLWLHRATSLAQLDQAEAAGAALDRALELDDTLADAWTQRGHLLRDAGRPGEAAACFERALACGGDAALNRYYLAAVRAGDTPGAPPRAYVETLFDQYAADFDQHLVRTLGYRGHERLIDELVQLGPRAYASALDLGCGTGLCGPLLRRIAARVDGVDLSAAMLEKARALGVYTRLVHADVAEYVAGSDERHDLVVAADVFIYVGRLEAVFEGVARVLERGGVFGFTVEIAADDHEVELLPSLRYAHAPSYLRELAGRFGFEVARFTRAPLREDQREHQDALYAMLVRR